MANPIAHIGTPGTGSYRVDWGPRQRDQEMAWRGIGQLVEAVAKPGRERAEQKSLAELMAFTNDGQKLLTEAAKRGIPLGQVREAVKIRSMLQPKESTEPFENYFNPATRERKAARRGSKEAAGLAQGGWLSGNPESTTPTQRRTAKDQNDVLRYMDDQAPVFPGVKAAPKAVGANPFETEQKLRKEFGGESGVFRKTQDSLRRVMSSADNESPAGDMALIFNFMKTLDPGSVVRESEFALAASTGSFGQQIQAAVGRVTSGQRLTPAQRADFVQTASKAYLGQADQQERRRLQYAGIAQQYGLEPGRALANYLDNDLLERMRKPQGQVQQQPVRSTPASDRFANVDWRGPAQNAPVQASLMSAQAQIRPAPGAVRKDEFGGGMSPGGRSGGDEFGSPFDASGIAPPAAPSPFETMGRAGLAQVDPNALGDADLDAYIAAMERETQGGRYGR